MIFAFSSSLSNNGKFDCGGGELKKCDKETDLSDELGRVFFGAERKFWSKYTKEEAGGRS